MRIGAAHIQKPMAGRAGLVTQMQTHPVDVVGYAVVRYSNLAGNELQVKLRRRDVFNCQFSAGVLEEFQVQPQRVCPMLIGKDKRRRSGHSVALHKACAAQD